MQDSQFWINAVLFVVIGAGLVWGFQALFKSGKKEVKLDRWFDKVLASDAPAAVKTLAQRAKDLELTEAAQGIKAFVDPRVDSMEARLKALEDKLRG